jgi:hypothetical protein
MSRNNVQPSVGGFTALVNLVVGIAAVALIAGNYFVAVARLGGVA